MNSNQLSQADKTLLLKLIMIADLSSISYKYLSKNQSELTRLEKDPTLYFKDDLVSQFRDKEGNMGEKDAEILSKVLRVIRTEPTSTSPNVKVSISDLFQLVGFFEELQPDTIEFNKKPKKTLGKP